MRNRICLALALFFALGGLPTQAQNSSASVLERKVTVTFNQAPLESVLRTLRRQYGVRISYSNTALDLSQPVTLSVQNQSLRFVLNIVLAGKNIGYELVGDQVVLHSITPSKPGVDSGANAASKGTATKATATTSSTPSKPQSSKPLPSKKKAPQASTAVAANDTAKSGTQSVQTAAPATSASVASVPSGSVDTLTATASTDSTAQLATPEVAAEKTRRPTVTKQVQVSFLGPLGSNGLRSGQTVNRVSLNVLGGYSAGVNGVEAAGLFNVDRDSVRGVQVAGLANVVGRNLTGFQGAGLLNVLGGAGTGWQAAGLFNVATRPVSGAQTAGLFNYVGPSKKAPQVATDENNDAKMLPGRPTFQAAGLFNVALGEVRGAQAAGLFNVGGMVRGVQLAGLLNVADSVAGVSIAPLNFVRRGYHRVEVINTESWPVSASLKLGGSPSFYTFFTGAYDGFGSRDRRWGLGYGVGTEVFAQRRVSLSIDAVAMHVNEESRGWTEDLNLHNQLRLMVGFAPLKAGGRLRIVAGPTVSVLVTQRYDTERAQVYSSLLQNRSLWLDEGDTNTRVLGWIGYSVGVRL
ncbi:hypothetical protein GCM10011375_14940 [Hymenobacter qilianensis]|uniref:Uncharacterized protein n=2 Tax=Hymenobacter qilianensis TaxID=1385715 RepID=A0ACB5PQ80_9BACT|nr:DUF4974 domain-containing protein [Hymenobacter qilianensis]QNP52999.1 hypothetical protein H9L05_04730 [Hymenobacter qilianensis]GGF60802.1 hypothetical protein GCM10011375_14940 [Hymenobacter qilianensis]